MADPNAAASTQSVAGNSSWDGDPARFTIEQWRNSCLINRGGDETAKSNYALPVRDPNGRLNRVALSAAASRLSQVEGISADKRLTVARQLITLYHQAGLPVPDHLQEKTGSTSRSLAHRGVERRSIPVSVTADPGSRTIGGYAAKFNRESRMMPGGLGGFIERVGPMFFEEARSAGWPGLGGTGVACRYNHLNEYLLGNTRSGTCQLEVDGVGLQYRTQVPKSRDDVFELIARGDVSESSFAFTLAEDTWDYSGGVAHRTLISGDLIDVAPVSAVAAYPDTSVALRSLAAHKDVPADEVFDLAARDELRRLFTRSDRPTTLQPWEIQHEHMQRYLDLWERRIKWDTQQLY
jgi:uncharacterized protein